MYTYIYILIVHICKTQIPIHIHAHGHIHGHIRIHMRIPIHIQYVYAQYKHAYMEAGFNNQTRPESRNQSILTTEPNITAVSARHGEHNLGC